jgi:hypothetical protein
MPLTRRLLAVAAAVPIAVSYLLASAADGADATRATAAVAAGCHATHVHFQPYNGVQVGLARLPWIAASPSSTGLVGHLFYYDSLNVWKQKRLLGLHIYSGGQSPDGRVSMKILWELRSGSAAATLDVRGKRLNGSGSFSQTLSSIGGGQFPSIIDVPRSGCWRLTLQTGKTRARVAALAV